ncbi:hypothetical protein [Saccharothrix violaceirubra]|uniref:Uncharacterized protein n=1 Tax=Saccharothrix violaceirubra TaxID=413306 RepID=A0A7W7TAL5_9PSEU|nr:hypothetical protein [Saccharothrix violaceirubra]MBB4969102.1 hypothetical protein [Saccharothrix violaceirubra]
MNAETRRALVEVAEVVERAHTHHRRRDEHDIDLGHTPRVTYSPLTLALAEALDALRGVLDDAAPA